MIANFMLAVACTNGTKQVSRKYISTSEIPVIDTLFVSSEGGDMENMSCNASATDFVILREDDKTMYADINQVIDAFGKYFIVDTYGSRKVVSFDRKGNPFASYGK